jgi:hypothetical protein
MSATGHKGIRYIYLIVYIPFLYYEQFLRNLIDYDLNVEDMWNVYFLFFILWFEYWSIMFVSDMR